MLTEFEKRFLELAAVGNPYKVIAVELGVASEQAMKNRARKIIQKLGADNITHAVATALRRKYIA